ncbi:beta family protein [Vibrio vulnificus]|nr:beta family protein [Vibrio vulnificus]EIA1336688.1 beta family protein [Vibrio vulnificus]EIU7594676.1 beta family protein [Vibrio vulnificus]EIX4869582.1 beta family protein [Vibrio vulnificus]EJE8687516.1 beta family protein [Vibrio vulnificus]
MNYFLFLKSKQGDFNSTRHMEKEGVVPVFDFISGEKTSRKIEAKQDKFIENIKRYHEKEFLFYIDHYDMGADIRYSSNIHPYSKYANLLSSGYNLGLVTGLDRDVDYQNEVIKYLKSYENIPVAIRLGFDDIIAPKLILPSIKSLYIDLAEYTSKIDLIIDCRVFDEGIDTYFTKINRFVEEFEKLAIDCLIIVTGSSIPEKINDVVKTGQKVYISRYERELWEQVKTIKTDYSSLVYGDYGVVSPDFEELDTDGPIPIVPKITYTFLDKYYLTRGYKTNTHKDGHGQYKTLAQAVAKLKNYRTSNGFGEKYIETIADKTNDKKGNPTTWITATMVQHIDYVKTIL